MNTKLGTPVKQIVPAAIEGVIDDVRWNKEADCKEIHVTFSDADGNPTSRWFLETELEVTGEAPEVVA
jgi:hypothetical protein